MRLFLAITPPPEILERVAAIQAQARSRLALRGLRWEKPEKWHITLQFLGSIDDSLVEPLCSALAKISRLPPFPATLGNAGAFPNTRRPRVLWLGVGGDLAALHLLHGEIQKATSAFVPPETRPFTPHLTLARIPQPLRASEIKPIDDWAQCVQEDSGSWTVTEFQLWQSTLGAGGSRHTLVRAFPLTSGA